MLFLGANLLWCSLISSIINLMSVTIERYVKVVYPIRSKKILHKWVIYGAIAFAWISSFVYNMTLTLFTTGIVDGVCYGFAFWGSRTSAKVNAVWIFVSFFVLPVCLFVFCYGHILVVIRRQAKVMAAYGGPGPSTDHTHSNQIQTICL